MVGSVGTGMVDGWLCLEDGGLCLFVVSVRTGFVGTGMVDGGLCWDRYGRWWALLGQVW